MKKLLIIFTLLCLLSPVYALNGNPNAPSFDYDVSEQQAYYEKLKKDFYKKYSKRIDAKTIEYTAPEGAYYEEVIKPAEEYIRQHPYNISSY